MAVVVPFPGPTPLAPVQKIETQPTAPILPVPTYDEGGNSGAAAGIAINNGKVPDNYYGSAGVGSTGTGMVTPITMSGIVPTVVNVTQGAVTQDDLVAVNGAPTTAGKYQANNYSWSSTLFTAPPTNPAQPAYGPNLSTGTGVGVPVAAYAGGTTYAQNAQVLSGGIFYASLVAGNVGNTPASSPSKWQPLYMGNPVTQGPGGGWGFAIANPALLPAYANATTYVPGTVVGYQSVNSSYYIAPVYAGATTYAAGSFVIGTDNNVYLALQGAPANVGHDPTLTANQGVYWDQTNTTYSALSATYAVGQQVLKDGVAYACASTVVSVHPSLNSTIWGTGVTVTAWSSGATSASNAIVSYNNAVYISLQASNTGKTPGTQTGTTSGVGWWAPIAVAQYDDSVTYPVGAYATYVTPGTQVTTLYTVQTGQKSISQNPKVNNNLQINSTTGQDNLPGTVLWDVIGYGTIVASIYVGAASAGNKPDAANQLVGTNLWNYLVGGNNVASLGGDENLARAQISYPPLLYTDGSEYDEWNMGSYFGPAALDSPTLRTDYSTIVASVSVTAAGFSHTTTGLGTVTVKDNNGNKLTPGQRGVPLVTLGNSNTGAFTLGTVEDGTFLITGVAASAGTITAYVGNTRSGTVAVTLT